MKKWGFKNWSFMLKTLCCMLSIVLLTLLFSGIIVVPHMREILQNNYNNTMNLTLDMVRQNVENTIDHYERMAYQISGSDQLNRWLLMADESVTYQKEITNFLSSNIVGDPYIRSVVLHCTDGRIYSYSRYNELGVEYLARRIDPGDYPYDLQGRFMWSYDATLLPMSPAESKNSRILLMGVIKNRIDVYKNEVIATFLIEYDVDVIRRLYETASIDGIGQIEIWDLSENEYPIIQQVKEAPSSGLRDVVRKLAVERSTLITEWDDMLISARTISGVDWYLVGTVNTSEVLAEINAVEMYFYVVLTGSFIVAVLLSIALAFQITKPIKQLIGCMKRVEKGDLRVQIDVDREDEIGKLSESFNHMVTQLDDLIHEVYEVKTSEKEAQIAAMRAQMNPHFLYNTLDAISWTVSFGENEQACEMIACLSDMLRYSIKGSDFVTIRNEAEQAANYLYIQKKRMGDSLRYHVDIDEEIMECRVLKFFLQPIVENAVIHGLSGCGHPGEVWISAYIEGNDLKVCVADNGIGIAQERIPHILNGDEMAAERHAGIGLSNVNKRIKLTYMKEHYGISIKSDCAGTCVFVTLPVRV